MIETIDKITLVTNHRTGNIYKFTQILSNNRPMGVYICIVLSNKKKQMAKRFMSQEEAYYIMAALDCGLTFSALNKFDEL
jgi:hypothetical protein